MEQLGIETTQNVHINYKVANVGERIGATFIDYLVLFAYFLSASWIVGETVSYEDKDTAMMLIMLPYVFYHLLSEILMNGQSLGKKALKIKVIRADGAEATIGNYVVRWLFRIIDISLFMGIIAIVVISANGKGQRLGDIVARTSVISLRRKDSIKKTIYTEVPKDYKMKYESAYLLDEEDIRTIKEVLENYKTNFSSSKAAEYVRKTAYVVEKKTGAVNETTPGEFLEIILKDYNYYYTNLPA